MFPSTTRRRSPAVLAIVGIALTLTACGARVSKADRQDVIDQTLGKGGSGQSFTTGGGGTSTGGSTTGAGSTSTGGGGSSTAGAGSTSTGGGSTSTGGGGTTTSGGSSTTTSGGGTTTTGGAGTTTGGGSNGGATDVGVTANSITVATVADISGPVPGLFAGAVTGVQAYFAMINSQGGINGRQLKVDVGDSQLDCSQNTAQTQSRVSKDFAFVGNFSLNDDCGATVLQKHPNVPDVSDVLGPKTGALPNDFATAPISHGWRTGPLNYLKAKYGTDDWTHIGAIYAGVGSGPDVWANTVAAIKSTGGAVVHQESYGATTTDYTGTIIKMKNDGVKLIYINTTDGANTARFVNAARAQKVTWPIIFGGTGYDTNFVAQAGDNANGVFDDQQFAPFFNADEAAQTPAVAMYQKWMNTVNSGQTKDIFSVYGWTSAQLFVQALQKAGPKATQKSLLAALKTITTFDGGGILAPANPAGKKPATCWMLVQVVNGKYQRVSPPSPAKGFNCTGGYYYNPN